MSFYRHADLADLVDQFKGTQIARIPQIFISLYGRWSLKSNESVEYKSSTYPENLHAQD
jgi:hypothetical protein